MPSPPVGVVPPAPYGGLPPQLFPGSFPHYGGALAAAGPVAAPDWQRAAPEAVWMSGASLGGVGAPVGHAYGGGVGGTHGMRMPPHGAPFGSTGAPGEPFVHNPFASAGYGAPGANLYTGVQYPATGGYGWEYARI